MAAHPLSSLHWTAMKRTYMWSVSPTRPKQHVTFLPQRVFTHNLLYIQNTVMTSKHFDYFTEVCFMENAHRKCFWAFNELNSLIKLMCTLSFDDKQNLAQKIQILQHEQHYHHKITASDNQRYLKWDCRTRLLWIPTENTKIFNFSTFTALTY